MVAMVGSNVNMVDHVGIIVNQGGKYHQYDRSSGNIVNMIGWIGSIVNMVGHI